MVKHLDNKAVEEKLKEIREKDQENGILYITEGLFSMDSDTPNLGELQQICKKYNATLFLDMAHDFGVMGEEGKGAWENFKIEDKSNVIFMGAGSKTLCSNLGFVSCVQEEIIEYIKVFSTAIMFTNAVSPVQATSALTSLKIIRSPEGKQLRKRVLENATYLREKLNAVGIKTLGSPSPVVPVMIGDEKLIKVLARLMLDNGVLTNPMEFPAVPFGTARFRLQLQATHTKAHLDHFVEVIVRCLERSKQILKVIMDRPDRPQDKELRAPIVPKL
jgi:glycine C-acetyltransferase